MSAWAMTRHRLTVTEAERIFGVPARTIRRWVTEGRITDHAEPAPGHRVQRHLISPHDLEELIGYMGRRAG